VPFTAVMPPHNKQAWSPLQEPHGQCYLGK